MDICEYSVDNAVKFFEEIKLNEKETKIAKQILKRNSCSS